jgi:ABC-type branched-subunit amino acid transport system substrate-binding protein
MISTIHSQSYGFQDVADAFMAAVDSINAQGGIKGHKLQAIVCDDQGQAAVAAQCANTLINTDKVVALGGDISGVDAPVYPVAKAGSVPIFCGNGGSTEAAEIPTYFACDAGIYAYTNMPILFQPGWKNVSLLYFQGLPSTSAYIENGIKTAGSDVQLAGVPVPLTTVDFGPILAEAKSQHADALISQLSVTQNLAIMQAEVSSGTKIPLLTTGGQATTQAVTYAAKNNIPYYIASAFITDPQESAMRAQELSDLRKYAPNIDDSISESVGSAWLFPYLLKLGSESGQLTNFTRAGIAKWAAAQRSFANNYSAPLNWADPGPLSEAPRFGNLWALPIKVTPSGQEVSLSNQWETLAGKKATLPLLAHQGG